MTHGSSFVTVIKVNKKTALVISAASIILLITPAFAQDSTSSTKVKLPRTNTRSFETPKANMSRERLDNIKTKIASREATVKLKLAKFKDQQKAKIAEKVNTNLNKINQNQTDQMLVHLDKMTVLLDKLTARVSTNQAIADSRVAIDTAKTAVLAQAEKDYTITVTTETKIRLDAQSKRDQLHKDINTVRGLVIAAKQSVSNAVRVIKSTPKEATVSGQ